MTWETGHGASPSLGWMIRGCKSSICLTFPLVASPTSVSLTRNKANTHFRGIWSVDQRVFDPLWERAA